MKYSVKYIGTRHSINYKTMRALLSFPFNPLPTQKGVQIVVQLFTLFCGLQLLGLWYNYAYFPPLEETVYRATNMSVRFLWFQTIVCCLPSAILLAFYNYFENKYNILYKAAAHLWCVLVLLNITIFIIDTAYYSFKFGHIDRIAYDLWLRSIYITFGVFKKNIGFIAVLVFIFALLYRYFYKKFETIFIEKISFTRCFVVFFVAFMLLPGSSHPLSFLRYKIPVYPPQSVNGVYTFAYSLVFPYNYLAEPQFMPYAEAQKLVSQYHLLGANTHFYNDTAFQPKNICIILLESCSAEFLDKNNPQKPKTPFLDSLLQQSWNFQNAFANGVQSDDGVTATVAGIPLLMRDAYYTSAYLNKIKGFAHILQQKKQYSTHFYYNTEAYRWLSGEYGFERYYTHKTLNLQDSTSKWGTTNDHRFFRAAAKSFSQHREPFITTIFNTDTHYPFDNNPPEMAGRFTTVAHKYDQAFSYLDYSLRTFFYTVKNEKWFKNTIFVFVGDHYSRDEQHDKTLYGRYHVPLAFYAPDGSLPQKNDSTVIQQTDIGVSLLDILQYKGRAFSFGRSVLAVAKHRYSCNYQMGKYRIFDEYFMLETDESTMQPIALFLYKNDPQFLENVLQAQPEAAARLLQQLKATLQVHHKAMINGDLQP